MKTELQTSVFKLDLLGDLIPLKNLNQEVKQHK